MGLDNSISLYTRHKLNLEDAPDYVQITEALDTQKDGNGYIYDIIYFRKSWAFRGMMYKLMYDHGVEVPSEGETNSMNSGNFDIPATPKIIRAIQDGLYSFMLNPDDWDDNSQVFTIDDVAPIVARNILTLSWLSKQLEDIPGAYLIFVDSW